MTDFLDALKDPAVPFLRYALIVGLLASVPLGIVGSYVVTRRITYIAAAISHCVLGGVGAALYFNTVLGWSWCNPMYGALAAALVSAILIGLISLYAREREDTAISAVWAIGMAVGLLFFAKMPSAIDPMSYLFGNILLISRHDAWLVGGLGAVVVVLGLGFYNKLLAVCFDEEFTELRGVKTKLYYLLLLCLTALTVVLLIRIVGIVLVIALLALPSAVAGQFARQLWQMMGMAMLCCMTFLTAGIAASYPLDFPSGPVIVLTAGATYLSTVFILWLRKRHTW